MVSRIAGMASLLFGVVQARARAMSWAKASASAASFKPCGACNRQPTGAPFRNPVGKVECLVSLLAQQFCGGLGHEAEGAPAIRHHGHILGQLGQALFEFFDGKRAGVR